MVIQSVQQLNSLKSFKNTLKAKEKDIKLKYRL